MAPRHWKGTLVEVRMGRSCLQVPGAEAQHEEPFPPVPGVLPDSREMLAQPPRLRLGQGALPHPLS